MTARAGSNSVIGFNNTPTKHTMMNSTSRYALPVNRTQLLLPVLGLTLFLAIGSKSRAQQPAADTSTNATTPAAPTYPPAAELTDAQLAKELTDLGAIVKTEGDAPDGAIVTITFTYTHTARPTPTGAMAPPYMLTDDLLARISKLPKLTHLELNMCTKLTEAGFANLKGMTQLQALALPYPIVNDTILSNLAGLTNLTYFRASGAVHPTNAGWAVVANWKNLQTFWAAEGSFGDNEMQYLKGLTQLKDITFYGDKVTDAGADVLLGLPNLTSVRCGPRMTPTEVAKLQAALPKCRFFR